MDRGEQGAAFNDREHFVKSKKVVCDQKKKKLILQKAVETEIEEMLLCEYFQRH